jgi:hypothetical protein
MTYTSCSLNYRFLAYSIPSPQLYSLPTASLNINVLEEYVKAVAHLNNSSMTVVRSFAGFTYNLGVGVEKILKSARDGDKAPSMLQKPYRLKPSSCGRGGSPR